jgi:hypothetical protein
MMKKRETLKDKRETFKAKRAHRINSTIEKEQQFSNWKEGR